MTIELDFGEKVFSAYAQGRLVRHLEQVRLAVVELLQLDDSLRTRRIVFHSDFRRSPPGAVSGDAAGDAAADDLLGIPPPEPRSTPRDGDLEVRIPRALRNPAIIERLMVGQLLHAGFNIAPAVRIRFLLDGVLGIIQAQNPRQRPDSIDPALMQFLHERGPDNLTRSLQPFLSGRCAPEERRLYFAAATSFVRFVITRYGPRRLGNFAGNLKPLAPNEASRAAFNKPFHAIQAEWRARAQTAQDKPLSLPGSVAKGLKLYARQRLRSSIVLLSMLPALAYTLAMPIGLSILFDKGILRHDAHIIERTLLWLTLGYVVSAASSIVQDWVASIAAAEAIAGLRQRLFVKAQKLADDVLRETGSGELTSTFSSDMMLIETIVTRILPNLLFRVILLIGSVIIAFSMEWHMALASVVCLPIAFLAPQPLARVAGAVSYQRKTEDAALNAMVQENVLLSRTIRMFRLQQNRLDAFRVVWERLEQRTRRANVYSALAGRLTTVGASFVQLLVIGMGAVLSETGELGAGVVIAFIGLLLNMGGAIAMLADSMPLLIQSVGAWQRVDMLLDAAESPEEEVPLPSGRWSGIDRSIAFSNVFFNFAGGDAVLDKISFDLNMGESVAFVGPSGSGKSTILNLLQRHIDATDGVILMDGTCIGAIASDDLRRRMAIVAQDNPLFDMSVRENIRMGRFDATDEDIVAAAKAAEIDEAINRMAHGYDTPVGEGGNHLSGGQRQRIAIARALLRNPSVLLLDEPTSALGPLVRKAINATLARLRPGRLVLTVTHSMNEAAEMDKIIVMDQGRVVEIGSHHELLGKQGFYADLWRSQYGLTLSDDDKSAGITIDRLRAIPFFSHLADDRLAALADAMQSEAVEANEVLLREGRRPGRFYILVHGEVTMSVKGPSGRPVPTRRLQRGDFFGDFALLPDARQVDTATTATACTFLTLRRDCFLRVIGADADAIAAAERAIASRLEAKLDRLVEQQTANTAADQRAPA